MINVIASQAIDPKRRNPISIESQSGAGGEFSSVKSARRKKQARERQQSSLFLSAINLFIAAAHSHTHIQKPRETIRRRCEQIIGKNSFPRYTRQEQSCRRYRAGVLKRAARGAPGKSQWLHDEGREREYCSRNFASRMRAARTMSMQMIGRRSIWSGGVRIFRARQKSSAQQPPDNGRTALRMQRCAASLFEFVAFSARARLFRETTTTDAANCASANSTRETFCSSRLARSKLFNFFARWDVYRLRCI